MTSNVTDEIVLENKPPDQAAQLATAVEKWLGNPVLRRALKVCTKRDKCGRRIELLLKEYAGDKQDLCFWCKSSKKVVFRVMDYFIEKSGAPKQDIITNLRDPMWRKGLSSVLEGIAMFGPQKPFTSYSPFLVVWNITRSCNLSCRHCYENAHYASKDELTTEQALKAVDDMADAGVAYIAVSGGEPLVRPDLFKIAEHMGQREVAFSIATNGTLLTKENVRLLKDAKCLFIQVSLDGANAKTHDWLRGKGAFNKAIKGIKTAIQSGITTGIACTVTKRNLKEIPAMLKLAEKLGVDIFMHYNFIPTGRGKEIVDLDITPEERETLLNFLANETKKGRKVKLLSTAPQYARVCAALPGVSALTHFDTIGQDFGEEGAENIKFLAEFVGGCGTARLYCAMEPNGDIEPCVFIPIVVGNIKTDSLVRVWQNNETMKALRDRKNFKGNCRTCNSRNLCGGCRARAYGYYRDVQQCDPGCILNKSEWDKIKSGEK